MKIRRKGRITLAVCSVILSAGCVPVIPVEPVIGVSGVIVDVAGEPIENCRLAVFRYGETDPYGYIFEKSVQSRFTVRFGHIQPDSEYRAVIECAGDDPVSVEFQAELDAGNKEHDYRPVDLGTIRVGKAP